MTTIKWRTSDAAAPESLGDADLLTTLLAAAKVKQPRATANALLAEYGSFAEALGGATGMQEQATAYLATGGDESVRPACVKELKPDMLAL